MREWFILVYKMPSEPSRLRAAVWRKLKATGAIYLQDGVATLPAETSAERVLRGLAVEIREMGGIAHLLQAVPVGSEEALVATFNAARDAEYRELLGRCRDLSTELAHERAAHNFTFAELEENEDDLAKLEAWRDKIRARDRFLVPLGAEADAALSACREDLDAFAATVYDSADHGAARQAGHGADERESAHDNDPDRESEDVGVEVDEADGAPWQPRHGGERGQDVQDVQDVHEGEK